MIDAKVWLVTGPGGSRIDFIAGWLGSLPNFISTRWSIHPSTGASSGEMHDTKQLDDDMGVSIAHYLSEYRINLTSDSQYTYAGSCHGYALDSLIDEVDDSVKVFYINPEPEYYEKVRWEFFVKTWLTPIITRDETPTPAHAELMDRASRMSILPVSVPYTRPRIILSYGKLFSVGGSKYLCEVAGIDVEEKYHRYYDAMLSVADSPDEITVNGSLWKRSDYF